MSKKPYREIITFILKRFRLLFIHLRDRVTITFHDAWLTDNQFFQKLELRSLNLRNVTDAVEKGNYCKAKRELLIFMRNRKEPRFFFDPNKRKLILESMKSYFPESKNRTLKNAEEILKHRFHVLGKDVYFPGKIDWHSTMDKKGRWPLSFSPNIDFFSDLRIGDIKLAWELNRTQHLVTLGKGFFLTGDVRYLTEFQNQVTDWIESNPYKRGINWMEGIETSIRLISWIWTYNFFLKAEAFNDEFHTLLLKSIYQQAKYIWEHLSDKWQLNNNHIIAELVGIIYVGIIFPEFIESKSWKEKGLDRLSRELDKQILPDGVTWERSTGYHKFVTDLCLHILILARKNNIKVPNNIPSKIEKMIDFLNSIIKTNGRIPLIGDGDDARVLKIDETEYDDPISTITVGSVLFNRSDWVSARSEEAFWLLGGTDDIKQHTPRYSSTRIFRDAGYCVMRGQDRYLLFIIGPMDRRYSHASHSHLDLLSVVVDAFSVYFLVDPGTYTYFGEFEWRNYFRSNKTHNTIVVNDRDVVEMKELFEIESIPISQIRDISIKDKFDYILAKYSIPERFDVNRLIIFVKPEYWIVIDVIDGNEHEFAAQRFHLNTNGELHFDDTMNKTTLMFDEGSLVIAPLKTLHSNIKIIDGSISTSYGIKESSKILEYSDHHKPSIFITVLYPNKFDIDKSKLKQKLDIKIILDCDKSDGRNILKIKFPNFMDTITYYIKDFLLVNKQRFKITYNRKLV